MNRREAIGAAAGLPMLFLPEQVRELSLAAERRSALLPVSADQMLGCVRGDVRIEFEPRDAIADSVHYCPERHCWLIALLHESFETVPFGQKLPVIERTFSPRCKLGSDK